MVQFEYNNTKVTITFHNINIQDSYRLTRLQDKYDILMLVVNSIPMDYPVSKRSLLSMLLELSSHNLLYRLNYKRVRTGSVDLDTSSKWYIKVAYSLIGWFGLFL